MLFIRIILLFSLITISIANEQKQLEVLGDHVLFDVRYNRSGRGDVAAGLLLSIELKEHLNYKGSLTILADEEAFKIISDMRGVDFSKTYKDPDYGFQVLSESDLSKHPEPVSFYVRPAAGSPLDRNHFPGKKVSNLKEAVLTVFAASEGRYQGNTSKVYFKDGVDLRTPPPGVGEKELGVYYDPSVKRIENLEKEDLNRFIYDELSKSKNIHPGNLNNIKDLLQLKDQRKLDLALTYGIWREDQKEQFMRYALSKLKGLGKDSKPTIFLTPQEADFTKHPNWQEIKDRIVFLDHDDIVKKKIFNPDKVYIYKTKQALPQSVFTSLMKASSVPFIIAGDASLSSAMKLGKPFMTTKVPWNTQNLINLADRLCRMIPEKCNLFRSIYISSELNRGHELEQADVRSAFSKFPESTEYSLTNLIKILNKVENKRMVRDDLKYYAGSEFIQDALLRLVKNGDERFDRELLTVIQNDPQKFIDRLWGAELALNPFLKRNSQELLEIYRNYGDKVEQRVKGRKEELLLYKLRGYSARLLELQRSFGKPSVEASQYVRLPKFESEVKVIDKFMSSNINKKEIALMRSIDFSDEAINYIEKIFKMGESDFLPVLAEILYRKKPDNYEAQRTIFMCFMESNLFESICKSLIQNNDLRSEDLMRDLTNILKDRDESVLVSTIGEVLLKNDHYPQDQKNKLLGCLRLGRVECAALLLKHFSGDPQIELNLLNLVEENKISSVNIKEKVLKYTPLKSDIAIKKAIANKNFDFLHHTQKIPDESINELNRILRKAETPNGDFERLIELNTRLNFADKKNKLKIVDYVLQKNFAPTSNINITTKESLLAILRSLPNENIPFQFDIPPEKLDEEIKSVMKITMDSLPMNTLLELRSKGLQGDDFDRNLINIFIKKGHDSGEIFSSLTSHPIEKSTLTKVAKELLGTEKEAEYKAFKAFIQQWGFREEDLNLLSSICPSNVLDQMT